jgi:hypothetical protein
MSASLQPTPVAERIGPESGSATSARTRKKRPTELYRDGVFYDNSTGIRDQRRRINHG